MPLLNVDVLVRFAFILEERIKLGLAEIQLQDSQRCLFVGKIMAPNVVSIASLVGILRPGMLSIARTGDGDIMLNPVRYIFKRGKNVEPGW